MENEMTNDAAVAECPKCGAPCDTFVHMRGGDYGWSTTDLERTDYKYSATTVAELRARIAELEAAIQVSERTTHSHRCRKCLWPYTPERNESEDCPKCGHDGSPSVTKETP